MNIEIDDIIKNAERCKANIDNHLLKSGMPELYAGNPYDWIFLFCLNEEVLCEGDTPLELFRLYVMTLYYEKNASTNP